MKRFLALSGLLLLAACARPLAEPTQFVVFFHAGTSALSPSGKTVVGIIAEAVHDHDPSRVEVAGYADGGAPHDAALADERATAVVAALTAAGVSPAKIDRQPSAADAATQGVIAHKVVVTLEP